MKVFISYSLTPNDEFILTLLSFMLKEDNIDTMLSQNDLGGNLDSNTKSGIEESSIFIAFLLNFGGEKARVLAELEYAKAIKIPTLIITEDRITNKDILRGNSIVINREKIQETVYRIVEKINIAKSSSSQSSDSIAWILAGKAIIASLNSAFQITKQDHSKYVTSGRLKLIEHQLLSIDSAAFQNLCDIYLHNREQGLTSINRTGSKLGKQKTVKGTPDTFFRHPNGSLCYIEYTTKADGLVAKIISDIDSCLDPSKTGVPINQVYKIIICFNSRLGVADETIITQYALSQKVEIELIGIDWLALEIYSKYLMLAKDILGIPLDTGQLLSLQNFIEEYNNKADKLSTPLDNIFLHRESELATIEDILANSDLLIISGFPGIGKTKIALRGIESFLSSNPNYLAFAISKKDQDIAEDLKIHLQQDRNYILLIDDANRQLPNFKQILGIFKESRKGNIKLVLTVREYALNDVINECFEFNPQKITLKKFTDEEITELLNSDSFEIKNQKYQKKIIEVADGNARLSVMAARIAKQQQEFFLLGDVSDLYDTYFHTFIKDFDIFGDKILIKTIGIISFFFTVDRNNKEIINLILELFDLDYYDFNEAIDELHRRELVEVQFSHVRISEQVMATYFFYKVFIKDETLSFKTLLFNFFLSHKKRFSDTIIPSNNSFGYENVLDKINGILDEYLESIYTEEEKVLEFFSIFWFYKREDVLTYFYQKIENLPEPIEPIYDTKYETNDFTFDSDKTLNFITNLFLHFTESYTSALELAFEYCRKKPESLPELVKRIKEKLLFDEDDYGNDFQRQVELFNLIIQRFKLGESHYVSAFFALAGKFLSHHYQISKGGRKHTVSFYNYPLPFYKITKKFRESIWTVLFDYYDMYPNEIFAIIKNFKWGHMAPIPKILEFDLSLLLPFIENNLNQKKFEHIYFIYDFVAMLDRENSLPDKSYQNLKAKFNSEEYEYFKKLDWNTLRGRQEYDFKRHEDFKRLKGQDIRASFVFKNTDEFAELHKAIKNILSLGDHSSYSIYESLNIILEENFVQNNELGFQLLESILNNYPSPVNPLYSIIKVIVNKSEGWALRLWELIKSWEHEYKIYWQLSFFDCFPNEYANDFYKDELLGTIKSINIPCHLQFESFEKFISIENDILQLILKIMVDKIEDQNIRISLSYHFFEKYSTNFINNFELIKKAYIQQEQKINNTFDLNKEGLETLTQINPHFFIEYIRSLYSKKKFIDRSDTDSRLSFVWNSENFEKLVEEAANIIIENSIYSGLSNHPLIMLFNHISEEQKPKSKRFILSYISNYSTDKNKISAVFSVLRKSMNDFFEDAFLHYLKTNPSLGNFEKISWIGNGGTYRGDAIVGEIRAEQWRKVYDIINKAPNGLNLIPIKNYVRKRISSEIQYGEQERKRKFIDPDGW